MANTIANGKGIGKIAGEALVLLKNSSVMLNLSHRGYEEEFKEAYSIGDTINVKVPNRARTIDGPDITGSIGTFTEKTVPIVVDTHKVAAFEFTAKEMYLDLDKKDILNDVSDRVLADPMIKLSNDVDRAILARYVESSLVVGSVGTNFDTYARFSAIPKLMDQMAIPRGDRSVVFSPNQFYTLADALKGVFAPSVVKSILLEAALGRVAGVDIVQSQDVYNHTAGAGGGTPLVNGASQTGASLVTDGWPLSTAILKKGDLISLANVKAINPVNYQSHTFDRFFTVTADVTSDGAGAATIPIDPPITTSGGFQNVSGSAADNAAITLVASHEANLAFHKKALAHVVVPLAKPLGATMHKVVRHDNLAISVWGASDVLKYTSIVRADVLFGTKMVNPELAVRVID